MSRKRIRTARSAVRITLQTGAVVVAFITSFVFSMWLSRTLSPQGEWLANGLTAFGFPIAWLVLTLLYAHLIVASTNWFFRLLWPERPDDGYE